MARKPANAEPDFETTLAQLGTIVTKLESGELPLEDALKEFGGKSFTASTRQKAEARLHG